MKIMGNRKHVIMILSIMNLKEMVCYVGCKPQTVHSGTERTAIGPTGLDLFSFLTNFLILCLTPFHM